MEHLNKIIELQDEVIRLQKQLLEPKRIVVSMEKLISTVKHPQRLIIGKKRTGTNFHSACKYSGEQFLVSCMAHIRNNFKSYGYSNRSECIDVLRGQFLEAEKRNIPLYTSLREALLALKANPNIGSGRYQGHIRINGYEQCVLRGIFYNPEVLESAKSKLFA